MPGSQRQSSSTKPVCWDSMLSAVYVMMPPYGIHMMVSAQANGDDHIKGEKIDFKKLDLQRCEVLDIEGGMAYSVKAYSKAVKRNIKVVVHYL